MIEHMFVSIAFQPQRSPWAHLHVPVVDPTGWGVDRIHIGLRDLERIRRQVEAATALLVAALPENRDSVASLAREIGVATREARRRRDVAAVVAAIPNAGKLLAGGALSAEHVAALVPVIGDPAAASLAETAVDQTPEEVSGQCDNTGSTRNTAPIRHAGNRRCGHFDSSTAPKA